ncbi:MAG TPA: MFS transporter [Solirubrobacteraceae bacterium]|nr:MFS transporter [Solirubrobacteraceae bacterium]
MTSPIPAAPAHTASRPNVTLAVLALVGLVYALLQSLVAPALPTIQRELGASESGVAWILSGYLLSAAVATPILGRLGDVHGKRNVMMLTIAGMGAGTLIAAVATSLPLMVAGRVVQGVGGGVFPLAFGIVRDEFPKEKVAGSIGFLSALLGLGGGVGVVLSGLIVDHMSYHWIFWLPLAIAVIALIATALVVPESPVRAKRRINWAGAGLMSIGLSAVLLAVSQTHLWGWGSPKTLGLIAAGLIVLFAWVRSELRSDSPLVDMRVMALRGVWTTNLTAVLLGVAMFSGFVLIPQFVQTPSHAGFGFGSSVTAAGMFLVPMSLAMLLVGTFAGSLERRFGSKPPLIAGVGFVLASFVMLLAVHDSQLPLFIASAGLGTGMGFAFAAMANLIVQAVPPDQTGVATGINTVARSVGSAFGSQIAATLVAGSVVASGLPTVDGYNQAFLMGIAALVICLGVSLLIPSRSRARQPAPAPAPAPA